MISLNRFSLPLPHFHNLFFNLPLILNTREIYVQFILTLLYLFNLSFSVGFIFKQECLLQVQITVDSWDLPALSEAGFHCCVLSLSVSSQHAFNSRAPSNSMELLSAFRGRLGLSPSLARVWLDLLPLKAKNMSSLFPTQAAGWWSITSEPSLFSLLWSMNATLLSNILFFSCRASYQQICCFRSTFLVGLKNDSGCLNPSLAEVPKLKPPAALTVEQFVEGNNLLPGKIFSICPPDSSKQKKGVQAAGHPPQCDAGQINH